MMDHLTGRTFKGYELRECLGEGGFGAVYRAFQPLLGRDVAVKVIRSEFANHPDFIRRFEAEAQVIARLEHPHIVPLYDYWRDPTGAFLIMRWLRGGSLQTALASGPCSLVEAQRLMEHLAGALSTAHRHGVVHRDVKPANVLRDEEGNYYLADFGIAKDLGTDPTGSATAGGAMLGSPAYMAPEQIKQEPVTPQTDIYLLGVLLFEVFTGQKPFAGATPTDLLYQHLYEPLPSLRLPRPDLPPALTEVIQRATQKPPGARYPDVLSLLADFTAAAGAGGAPPVAEPRPLPMEVSAAAILENPYKGLRAFQEADAPDFFGRAALIERLLGRLGDQGKAGRFLAVVGPSGSGKSSVVRAGLLPALRGGLLPGADRWFFTEVVPGSNPLEELEAALLRVAVNPPASLLEQLQADPRGLSRAVKRVLPADPGTELVLLIDQFEELFTLVEAESLRAHVLRSLALAVADPRSRLRVILTLRADFYDRPLLYPELGELMRHGTELVLPLTAQELEQAIAQPAARVGVTVEPALSATAIKDVGDQPGGLPLLQYALTELFDQRQGRRLTLAGYQASGGVLGALARRADEIYGGLTPEAQDLARQVFLRLVTLGEGVEDTRRRAPQRELAGLGPAAALAAVLEGFGQHRLLTFDRDPITREPTVEVAHEALLRTWGRLRDWLDAGRMAVRTQRQLAAGAAEWERAERDPSFLAGGTRLAQFAALAEEESEVTLTPGEQRYLAASQAEAERQATAEQARQAHELALARESAAAAQQAAAAQRRAANGLRGLAGALALFLVVAALLTLFAFSQQSEAASQRLAAQNNAATAVANGAVADAQRATAVANGAIADAQRATAVTNGVAAASARATAQANLTHSEALRLAAEASRLMQTGGSPELAALLSVRALRDEWTPQGDAALEAAARLDIPVQQFVGQTDDVGLTLFSPDGKTLWGDSNSALFAWDVATGRQLPVPDFGDGWYILALSPDGRHIAIGRDNGTIAIWDSSTMTQTRVLTGHTGGVNRTLYSPDGQYLLSNSQDNTARVWNVTTGQQLQVLQAESNGYQALAWSPDGKYALTGGNDNIARLWDVQTGRLVQRFDNGAGTGPLNGVSSVAYGPDGKTIATSAGAGNSEIWIWNVATGAPLLKITSRTPVIMFNIAYSGDGKTIFSSSYQDTAARLWDTATGQQLRVFRGPKAAQTSAFAPDGRHAVVGYFGGTVLLWDTAARPELPIFIGHTESLSSGSFSADDRTVLTGSPGDHTARLWDATSGQALRQFHSPNDSTLNSVAFSPDGKYLLIGDGHGDKAAHTVDLLTGTILQTFQHEANVNQAVYSPDGQTVLTASLDKTARLWNAATGQLLHTLQGDMSPVYSVAYAPDGKTVLTAGRDGIGRLWDAQTGTEIRRFVGHTQGIEHILYSPDGQRVLTASDDETVRLWDLQTSTQLGVFAAHGNDAAFSPDGTRILTSGGDQVARLWDINGSPTAPGWGRELRSLAGHTGSVGVVAFSHDGKLVLTGSDDNTARLWHVDYHDTIHDLCRRLIRDLTEDERTQYNISDSTPTCPGP